MSSFVFPTDNITHGKELVTAQDRSDLLENMRNHTKKGSEADPKGDNARETDCLKNAENTDNEGM